MNYNTMEPVMAQTRGKTPRYESVISLFLLAVLFIIGLSVVIPQFNLETSSTIVASAEPRSLDNLLSSIVPAGFEPLSEIAVYNAENLYEKINGKAPFYVDSGFEMLLTNWLKNQTDNELMFEFYVYDMAEPANAFSVFSIQKRPDASPMSGFEVNFGYRTENAILFVKGRYYIELIGSAKSEPLFNAMTEFAKKLSATLPDQRQFSFPNQLIAAKDNLIPGSIKFYTGNALGFDGFDNTFTAVYKIDSSNVTIFLSQRPDEKNAEQLVRDYCKFLIETGAEEKSADISINKARVLDFYGTIELVFNKGPIVAGIHEAEDIETAVKLAPLLNDILKSDTEK
jgi:hypothetical protein